MEQNRQIFIITDNGTKVTPFYPDMMLSDFKNFIENKYNYIKDTYFLKYNGRPIYENKKLIDYNIRFDDSIHVVIRAPLFYQQNIIL